MESHRPGAAETLRALGLRPKKSLGQTFLRDRSFLARIVDAAGIRAGERVLEIGPGTGILTEALLDSGANVSAVELDDQLFLALEHRLGHHPTLRLLHDDGLQVDPSVLFDGPYKLVANIPYYITGPLVRHFLEASHSPERLVLMVQREVAQRMVASPGDLSLLGISVQYYAAVRIAARVPAAAFYPRPKVDSAVVVLDPFSSRPSPNERDAFFTVARAGFHVRRKQLVNSVGSGLGLDRVSTLRVLDIAGIAHTRRAEELSIEEWKQLAHVWQRETAAAPS